jgi:hypothetical protein
MRVGRDRTQELKLMAVGVTPRLLSWSSSWNLMGNAGAMVNLVRSAARDQERIVANSPKGAVRWKEAGKLGIVTLKGVEVGGAESGHRAKRGRSQKLKDTRNQSACSIKKRTKQARGREF